VVQIEAKILEGLTLLAADARAFLADMPSLEALMPAIDVGALPLLPAGGG
jgi:hypothetical protein